MRRKKDPLIEKVLLDMVAPETAGDPMSEPKWVRRSLRALSEELGQAGHDASAPTVSRLLKKHDYSLRVNAKEKEASSQHPERDTQFRYIETQKQSFAASGDPYISVDTKKKELIGRVPGRCGKFRRTCSEPVTSCKPAGLRLSNQGSRA